MPPTHATQPFGSAIARSDATSIRIHGLDLCSELIGHVTITDFVALELRGRIPEAGERRLLDAFMVTIAEHGSTPSTIAARLTLLGSPDQWQSAVAAGLLGAGSRFLGSMGDCARLLQDPAVVPQDAAGDRAATVVELAGGPVPGIGHPLHKPDDPRSLRLFALARELGAYGPACATIAAVRELLHERSGTRLPINATGAIAAIGSDLGYPWPTLRGFALVARTVGILGHLAEETRAPMAQDIWDLVEGLPPHA